MDFNLKQWRGQHQQQQLLQNESEHEEQPPPPAKLPRLLFYSNPQQQQQQQALPLFVTEPPTTTKLTSSTSTTLSAYPITNPAAASDSSTKYPSPRMGGSYFSLAQWQELELQALIFRHMLSGAAVPPELLHLVKKSLITNNPSYPYYFPPPVPHYSHFQSAALLQSGYWGRASMDPEPRRCRRTDGKKWRCSRDVVAGQKYCERHMHRGRNRSRKPVENPTHTVTPGGGGGSAGSFGGGILKANSAGGTAAGGGGGTSRFALNGLSPSIDHHHLQLNQRSSEPIVKAQNGDDKASVQVLRHFFDDLPRRPLQQNEQNENAGRNPKPVASSTTNLSISISGNGNSDFSLRLSTGEDQIGGGDQAGNIGVGRTHPNWAAAVSSMGGGPLAEALRSSTSNNSSPTSVLHQLQQQRGCSASEASYVSY